MGQDRIIKGDALRERWKSEKVRCDDVRGDASGKIDIKKRGLDAKFEAGLAKGEWMAGRRRNNGAK